MERFGSLSPWAPVDTESGSKSEGCSSGGPAFCRRMARCTMARRRYRSLPASCRVPGIVVPAAAGWQVHRPELPLAQWIRNAGLEAPFLFLIANFEPEPDQQDSAGYGVTLDALCDRFDGARTRLGFRHDVSLSIPLTISVDRALYEWAATSPSSIAVCRTIMSSSFVGITHAETTLADAEIFRTRRTSGLMNQRLVPRHNHAWRILVRSLMEFTGVLSSLRRIR